MTAPTTGGLAAAWPPDDHFYYPGRILAASADIDEIPYLVSSAWSHALLFPEIHDDTFADLKADIASVIARERPKITAAAVATADARLQRYRDETKERAQRMILKAYQEAQRIAEQALDGLAASPLSKDGGIDPHGCFVYLLWENKDDPEPIYVGKSINLLSRLGQHMSDRGKRHRVTWITVIRCASAKEMDRTEAHLIRHYRPELNTAGIPAQEVTT